ncbi:hypothetical protein BCY91_02800 [Pelobium manganitolerans]|uniref:Uncharacterized protein n=1 Tax=Pelobium manganitolerans TaxID=1842495 RepID=A0A419S6Z7_9SPHI|nr:hypothetical protein [Pelobium manganitolerans]RKD17094.1 hypothetical protein BCY91_02800 [Pelobium manganitolerans]
MMETITPTLNPVVDSNGELRNTGEALLRHEIEFLDELKPALDQLIKNPSAAVVEHILAFSKSL